MRFRATRFLGLSLILLLGAGRGRAQESQPTEYQLKAAFLFNFAKFIEWPPQAFAASSSPLVLGVLGTNSFGGDFDKILRGKALNDRPLVVREVLPPERGTNCHILFISASHKPRLPEILKGLRGSSVLTVGETDGFIEAGGMINFVPEGNKIRFQINDTAAKQAGLKISSKLLSLAVRPAR
jgi:hypothetical protein